MPNSFSRFLNDEELKKVRDLYLQALEEVEQNEAEESQEKPAGSGTPQTSTEV
jgi:hypothetical protein